MTGQVNDKARSPCQHKAEPAMFCSYILNGKAEMPAFPVQAACRHLADPKLEGAALLAGLALAIGVFHNASGMLPPDCHHCQQQP